MKLQLHANDWFVRHARRILMERGPNADTHRALREMLADTTLTVPHRLRALWALHVSGGLEESLAKKLIAGKEPWITAWAIQLFFEKGTASSEMLRDLARLAQDQTDPNLTLMIWYGIEPLIPFDPARGASLLKGSKAPKIQDYIGRRMRDLMTKPR